MIGALEEFTQTWQPRQRPNLGMFMTLGVQIARIPSGTKPWMTKYDLPSLAMAAIHLVVDPTYLSGGWTKAQLTEALLPLAQSSAPALKAAQHREVITAVIDALLNTRHGGRVFQETYGVWDDGGYETKLNRFQYLYYVGGEEDTELTIKATHQAVNMYRAMFSLDLEDSQAADSFIAERQLDRGAVDEVVATVKGQQMTTAALAEQIDRQLARISRDVRSVEYANEVDPLINRVLNHVQEQIGTTDQLKDRVNQRIEPDRPGARQLMEVAGILQKRIGDLNGVLDRASRTKDLFVKEQDRQVWTRHVRDLPDPELELFMPLIGMPVGALAEMLAPVCAQLLGTQPPRLPSARLIADKCQPRTREAPAGAQGDPFELVFNERRPPRITAEHHAAVRQVLGTITSPTRLSTLLLRAGEAHPALCRPSDQHATLTELICVIVLAGFAPPVATEFSDTAQAQALARHRSLLDPDQFTIHNDHSPITLTGVTGDDLLIRPRIPRPRTADMARTNPS